jgi:hypothetical protein
MYTSRLFLFVTALGFSWAASAIAADAKPAVETLNPFTNRADIPADADLSSVRLQRVRMVRLATATALTGNDPRFCKEVATRDPGGSMYCAYPGRKATSPAWRVTYSYHAGPMASDEYQNSYFTFDVYFHPDELTLPALKTKSGHKTAKAEALNNFGITTGKPVVTGTVIDQKASAFCPGSFVEGSWVQAESRCEDKIVTKAVTIKPTYITVSVDPSKGR